MSFLEHPKVIPYTKFEHFGIIRLLWTLVRKMHLLTLWPWPLTFQPENHTISRIFQTDYSLPQVWTLWDQSFSSYAPDEHAEHADRQTNRRTRTCYSRRPTLSAWIKTRVETWMLTSNLSFLSFLSAQYKRMKKRMNITPTSMRPIGFCHGCVNIWMLSTKSIVFGLTKKPPAYVPTSEQTPTECEWVVCASFTWTRGITLYNRVTGFHYPSTRAVLTGNGNRSPVNSGRQLG